MPIVEITKLTKQKQKKKTKKPNRSNRQLFLLLELKLSIILSQRRNQLIWRQILFTPRHGCSNKNKHRPLTYVMLSIFEIENWSGDTYIQLFSFSFSTKKTVSYVEIKLVLKIIIFFGYFLFYIIIYYTSLKLNPFPCTTWMYIQVCFMINEISNLNTGLWFAVLFVTIFSISWFLKYNKRARIYNNCSYSYKAITLYCELFYFL